MSAKKALSRDELETHLAEQIEFLRRSCTAFDEGFEGEAKRLALTLRILLHDTKNSKSLLTQLGKLRGQFLDTALPMQTNSLMTHSGLVSIAMGQPEPRFVAMLDDVSIKKWVNFSGWWDAPVFLDGDRRELSRKQLILTAADQDGGAHVDPSLEEDYYALAKQNSLNWFAGDRHGMKPMGGPERAAIRQIAHEVLKSLIPEYSKTPKGNAGLVLGGFSLFPNPVAPAGGLKNPAQQSPQKRKIRRNELCFCGSGIKYKRCHGKL